MLMLPKSIAPDYVVRFKRATAEILSVYHHHLSLPPTCGEQYGHYNQARSIST